MSIFRTLTSTFISSTILNRLAIILGPATALVVLPVVAWWLIVHLVTMVVGFFVGVVAMVMKAFAPLIVLGAIGYASTRDRENPPTRFLGQPGGLVTPHRLIASSHNPWSPRDRP